MMQIISPFITKRRDFLLFYIQVVYNNKKSAQLKRCSRMLKTLIIAAVVIIAVAVAISYICFRVVFYVPQKNKNKTLPIKGKSYDPYRATMRQMLQDARAIPYTDCYTTSSDGLKLHAKYYECNKGAVTEIMFHGYRGSAERDLSGGILRCFALGRNALVVDQRTSFGSEGNVITFGIKEHLDCHSWVDFAVNHFDDGREFIITGISMGASTVLMAAGKPMHPRVKGVLADCGFTTAKDIICKCARQMKLPPAIIYPFVKLGAKLFGNFDIDSYSALEGVKNATLPVIFFHGEGDDFVPCYMSSQLYDACKAPKCLVTIPEAGHGLAYLVQPERYLEEMAEFFTQNGVETKVVPAEKV